MLINTNRCLYWQVIDFKNTISFDRKQENRQIDLIKGESCLYFPSKLVPMNFVTMGHQKKPQLISQRHRSRRLSELCNRGFQHWSSLQTNWLFFHVLGYFPWTQVNGSICNRNNTHGISYGKKSVIEINYLGSCINNNSAGDRFICNCVTVWMLVC